MAGRRYIEGLKFGMILQLAVGPMCLMVFNTAKNAGFWVAFSLVLAITLVDGVYIILAALGASKLLEKPAVKKAFRYIGGAVLILFGLNTLLGAFGKSLLPGLSLQVDSASVFLQGLVLTLSNPITILSAIAGLGTVLSSFLPEAVSMGLNVLVGVLIVFFGVKMMVKKDA